MRRASQPRLYCDINRETPLNRGLKFLANCGLGGPAYNSVNGVRWGSVTGAMTTTAAPGALASRGRLGNGFTRCDNYGTAYNNNGALTIAALVYDLAPSSNSDFFGQSGSSFVEGCATISATSSTLEAKYRSGGTTHTVSGSSRTVWKNKWVLLGFTSDGTTLRWYENGKQIGTTAAGFPTTASTNQLSIGSAFNDSAGICAMAALWWRVLSAAELAHIAHYPWHLFAAAPPQRFYLLAGAVSGSGAIAENADTVAGSGAASVSGSGAIAESADVVSGAGALSTSGSGAIHESPDTVAGSGIAGVSGSGAISEPADTMSGSGGESTSGSGAMSEGADTMAGTGGLATSGSGAINEQPDVMSGSGAAGSAVSGSGAMNEPADTMAGTGAPSTSGAGSIAEGADAASGAGHLSTGGAGAISEGADTMAGAGAESIAGSGAIQEGADTVSGFSSSAPPLRMSVHSHQSRIATRNAPPRRQIVTADGRRITVH